MIYRWNRILSRDFKIYKHTTNFLIPRTDSIKPSYLETVDLAYSVHDSADNKSNKPPLIILHGLFDSKNNWESLCKDINKQTGRRIVNVDARNHGDSEHSHQHTYLHMAHDVIKLVEKLELSKVTFIGHSMGGRTAMVLSLLYPDLVSSMILVDISPVKVNPKMFAMPSIFDTIFSISINSGTDISHAKRLAEGELKTITPDVRLRNFLILNLVKTETGSYAWKANVQALRDHFITHITAFPSSLKGLQFSGPVLLVAGALSDFVSQDDMPKIQEYFPLAELNFIDGVGHWLHEQQPDKFMKIVCKFLAEN